MITSQIIEESLRAADIEGYIAFGAPSDEYASEAEIISVALAALDENEVNVENVAAVISEVWRESFNLDASDLEARRAAIYGVSRSILQKASIGAV